MKHTYAQVDLDRMLEDTTIRDRVPSRLADEESVQRLISHVRALVSHVRVVESQRDEAMRHDSAIEQMLTGVQAENRGLRAERDELRRICRKARDLLPEYRDEGGEVAGLAEAICIMLRDLDQEVLNATMNGPRPVKDG